jgi:hypothetical protein
VCVCVCMITVKGVCRDDVEAAVAAGQQESCPTYVLSNLHSAISGEGFHVCRPK